MYTYRCICTYYIHTAQIHRTHSAHTCTTCTNYMHTHMYTYMCAHTYTCAPMFSLYQPFYPTSLFYPAGLPAAGLVTITCYVALIHKSQEST